MPITPEEPESSSPEAFYAVDGTLRVVFLRAGHLVLLNPQTGEERIGPVIDDGSFKLSVAADGSLTVIFSQSRTGQYDLFYAMFDAASETWGEPRHLTHDVAIESSPSLVYLSSDQLFAGFARTEPCGK